MIFVGIRLHMRQDPHRYLSPELQRRSLHLQKWDNRSIDMTYSALTIPWIPQSRRSKGSSDRIRNYISASADFSHIDSQRSGVMREKGKLMFYTYLRREACFSDCRRRMWIWQVVRGSTVLRCYSDHAIPGQNPIEALNSDEMGEWAWLLISADWAMGLQNLNLYCKRFFELVIPK